MANKFFKGISNILSRFISYRFFSVTVVAILIHKSVAGCVLPRGISFKAHREVYNKIKCTTYT